MCLIKMKILSVRFANLSPFSGSWFFNFDSPDFLKTKTFSILEKQSGEGKIILDAISLGLFGEPFFKRTDNNAEQFLLDKKAEAKSEVQFSFNGLTYKAVWEIKPAAGRYSLFRELKTEDGDLLDNNADTVSNTISSILEITPEAFTRILFLDFQKFSSLLLDRQISKENALSEIFGKYGFDNLPLLTKEVAKQKRIAADVSRRMLNAFEIFSPEKENQLNSQLTNLKQSIVSLKNSINDTIRAVSWLQQLDTLKEELQKLLKEESLLKADVARFDIKKPVLEKAVKAENLSSDFSAIKALREQISDQKKALEEAKTKISHSNERVKNAKLNLQEKEKLFKNAENAYNSKHAVAQKASELGVQASQYKTLITENRSLLSEENEKLKNISAVLTSYKDKLTSEKNKQQLLIKKISDCGGDEKLKNELFDYQNKIENYDIFFLEKEEAVKAQKAYQRDLEKARSEVQENESILASLKKEELVLQGDIAVKNRHINKALGNLSEESLFQDLTSLDKKLEGLDALEKLNEQLISQYERLNSERDILNRNNYESKVASVNLNSSIQAYKDKQVIVADAETILLFQQKVKNLESQRKQLENGKPCPLCGAIHHPYVSSIPFSLNGEEKLKEAQEEAKKAALTLTDAQQKFDFLTKAIEMSGTIVQNLNISIEDIKSRILGLSSQLELTGLKEKKPITWTQIIKQKKTFTANKREELKNKIEQIQNFKQAGTELLFKLQKVQARIKELTEVTEKRKQDAVEIFNLLQQTNVREAQLTAQQEELFKELDRFYLRFGIKVSSIASVKQQFSILVKRRESYVESTNELKAVEAEIEKISLAHQECLNEIVNLKNKIAAVEAEISRHDTEGKKLLKEKQDLLGASSPQEFEESAREWLLEAKQIYLEAENLFNQRCVEAQYEEAQYIEIEKIYQALLDDIERKQSDFDTKLKEAGFVTEAQFTASKITAQQKEELLKQNNEIKAREEEHYSRKTALTQEINDLASQNLTSLPLAKLRENLEKDQADLQVSLLEESEISEEIEHNLYTKQRYERESQEQRKREDESLRWEDFSILISSPANTVGQSYLYSIAFDILLDFSNKQLKDLSPRHSLAVDPKEPLNLLLVDEYKREQPLTVQNMNSEETYLVSLALSLGFIQMISQLRKLDLLFISKEVYSANLNNLQLLTTAVSKLNQQGKLIGVFSQSSTNDNIGSASIELNLDSITQIKGIGVQSLL